MRNGLSPLVSLYNSSGIAKNAEIGLSSNYKSLTYIYDLLFSVCATSANEDAPVCTPKINGILIQIFLSTLFKSFLVSLSHLARSVLFLAADKV